MIGTARKADAMTLNRRESFMIEYKSAGHGLRRVAGALASMLAVCNASAATGAGTIAAAQRVHVQTAYLTTDYARSAVNVALSLNADGTFTALVGVDTYEGTYTSSGTVYNLTPDAESRSALLQYIRTECGCSPTSITTTNWRVKINKSQTKAKLKFITNSALVAPRKHPGDSGGDAQYVISGKGSWASAPQ